jgi:phage gp29-like protein
MRLLERLEAEAATGESYFRSMLAKEDVGRIASLRRLAHEHATLEAFKQHALFIGWTKDDLRTHELKDHLAPVMEAIFAIEREAGGEDAEQKLEAAWNAFNAHRLKVLVHCL